eukprot:157764-Lingulodinium_polyedra.AAC.1
MCIRDSLHALRAQRQGELLQLPSFLQARFGDVNNERARDAARSGQDIAADLALGCAHPLRTAG